MRGQEVLFSHKSDLWETPTWLFNELNSEFNFNWDLSANKLNSKVSEECFFGETDDALKQSWNIQGLDSNTRAFCNPPYSK